MRKVVKSFSKILAISFATFLSGCITLSNYSATSYEHLTQLKAYHVKFIDDFTFELSQPIDSLKVQVAASAGDLKFREAEEYADGMKDGSRTFNIKVLHGAFNDDVKWLGKGQNFRKTYAEELKMIRKSSYDQAIKGEKIRAGSAD